MGKQRPSLTLPTAQQYKLTGVVDPHFVSLKNRRVQLPLLLTDLDEGLLFTQVVPLTARAGREVRLVNARPGFKFSPTRHGAPRLKADGAVMPAPTVVAGWDSALRLPDAAQLNLGQGVHDFRISFPNHPTVLLPLAILNVTLAWNLHIRRLDCEKTEDWIGGDECRLEVYCDGVPKLPWPPVFALDDPNGRDIKMNFVFLTDAEVKLFDEDVGALVDPDDFLGSAFFQGAATDGEQTVEFNLDQALYSCATPSPRSSCRQGPARQAVPSPHRSPPIRSLTVASSSLQRLSRHRRDPM